MLKRLVFYWAAVMLSVAGSDGCALLCNVERCFTKTNLSSFFSLNGSGLPFTTKDDFVFVDCGRGASITFPRSGKQPSDNVISDMALLSGGEDVSKTYMNLLCKYNLGFCNERRVPIIVPEGSPDFERMRSFAKFARRGTSMGGSATGSSFESSDDIWNRELKDSLGRICCTRCGRELVYRYVLEANRVDSSGNGITENRRDNTLSRNDGRCCIISRSSNPEDDAFYYPIRGKYNVSSIVLSQFPPLLSCIQRCGKSFFVSPVDEDIKKRRAAMFFHELLHAYKFIRNPIGVALESQGFLPLNTRNYGAVGAKLTGSCFFQGLKCEETSQMARRERVSALHWIYTRQNNCGVSVGNCVDYHEMRVIWGVYGDSFHSRAAAVSNGKYKDDPVGRRCHENAFRAEIGLSLRGGYVEKLGLPFPAIMELDEETVKRVAASISTSLPIADMKKPIFGHSVNGLGSSSIHFSEENDWIFENVLRTKFE